MESDTAGPVIGGLPSEIWVQGECYRAGKGEGHPRLGGRRDIRANEQDTRELTKWESDGSAGVVQREQKGAQKIRGKLDWRDNAQFG